MINLQKVQGPADNSVNFGGGQVYPLIWDILDISSKVKEHLLHLGPPTTEWASIDIEGNIYRT